MKSLLSALIVFVSCFSMAQEKETQSLSLPEVYALPYSQVEKIVTENFQSICDGLNSVYNVSKNNPAKLTSAEFCAVQHYSGGGYEVNKNLWLTDSTGSGLDGLQWSYVRVLDSALKKIKNEKPTVVYRGTSRSHLPLPRVGGVIRLKGYTSTSLLQEVAEEFIKDRLMIIKVRSGKNIKPYSNAGTEDEYLLPRSTFVRYERSEIKVLNLFTDEGPEERLVEVVYLTEL